MNSQKFQFAAVGLVCGLLGFGLASYRNLTTGHVAVAADPGEKPDKVKEPQPQGVFSPPGTSDSGTIVPPPGEPPFKGKIGRTIDESTPDWPPQPVAPKGAPNVLYIVLDDVGFAALPPTSCTSSWTTWALRRWSVMARQSSRRHTSTSWPRTACATTTSIRPRYAHRAGPVS
jgi:hypothetical protein